MNKEQLRRLQSKGEASTSTRKVVKPIVEDNTGKLADAIVGAIKSIPDNSNRIEELLTILAEGKNKAKKLTIQRDANNLINTIIIEEGAL